MSFVELIQASHVPLETRPEPYGAFHLLFTVLSLALIVLSCYWMRGNSDRTFRAVLFGIGALLLLSEVYKQFYYFYAAGEEGYDWSIFPFQLCSVPMYLCILVGCMRKSRVRDAICEYLVSVGFLGGFMAYVEPSGILNEHYFTLIHSCIWHALLIFIALYVLFTDNACHSLRDYRKALCIFGGVVLCATALNIIFREKPDFNMCYISPFYNTPLAVFKDFDRILQAAMGQLPGRILSACVYILGVSLGGFILYFAVYCIKRACIKKPHYRLLSDF